MEKIDPKTFHSKRKKLKRLRNILRKKYVGINGVIDEIVESLEAWYLMPELLTRPTIINLWGTTGVGKTELVDTIAQELGFANRYTKIELAGSSARAYSVLELFTSKSNVASEQQNVIFFDEFQNFRTISKNGAEIKSRDHTDFWELLNDGTLATKRELREITEDFRSLSKKPDQLVKSSWMGTDHELSKIKSILGLEETVAQLGEWPVRKMNRTLRKHSRNAFHKLDCTKSLIIIAGNLDEAYRFSDEVDEVDLDADDYHELSKKVNFLTIKKALTLRFKPEQIARLGNTHIIYPCLDCKAYTELIRRTLVKVSKHLSTITDLELSVESSVQKLIYDNGVFPTQGARPVFTTIREVVENNIPKIALFCTELGKNKVSLSYVDEKLIATVKGNQPLEIPYEGRVNALKKKKDKDQRAVVSVHEAGHAIAFAVLFGICPEKISVDTVSGGKAGYVKNPQIFNSKEFMEKDVQVLLAAQCAEKLVFGEGMVTSGASGDIERATQIVTSMARSYGLCGKTGKYGSSSNLNSDRIITECKNEDINAKLQDLRLKASILVSRYLKSILKLTEILLTKKSLNKEEFKVFLKSQNIHVEDREKATPNYDEVLKLKIKEMT